MQIKESRTKIQMQVRFINNKHNNIFKSYQNLNQLYHWNNFGSWAA